VGKPRRKRFAAEARPVERDHNRRKISGGADLQIDDSTEHVPENRGESFGEPAFTESIGDEDAGILEDDSAGGDAAGLSVEIEPPTSEAAAARNIADEDAVDASFSAAVVERGVVETGPGEIEWANELSPQHLYLELKRIEDEVKELLEARDPVRKRKLGGTRRWRDLEDEIVAWKYGDRFDEATLKRVQCLIARRHHLYRRLRFLAGTRPTWNS
jgi:hypothetical protein